MTNGARKQTREHETETLHPKAAPRHAAPRHAAPRRRRRPLLTGFVLLLVLGIGLLAAGPTIVLQPQVRDRVLHAALADLHGRVSLDDLSFGWTTPLAVKNLQLHDASDKVVINLPNVAGDRGLLWCLCSAGTDFGTLRMNQPHVEVELHDGATNLQDIFAEYLKGPSSGSQSMPTVAVELADASVVVRDVRSGQQWQCQKMSLKMKLAADSLEIQQLEAQSDFGQLQLAGKIDELSGQRVVKIDGKADYDLDQLTTIVQRYVGNQIQLSGRETGTFSLNGPLTAAAAGPSPLEGHADLRWQAINAYGVVVGPGRIQGTMHSGIATFAPIEAAVGAGRMHLLPQFQMAPGTPELMLGAGTTLDNIELTPVMCSQAMAYIAPVLAGSVQVQGKFSMALAGCRVPVETPTAAEVSGQMTIHNADAAPGPIVQAIAGLFQQSGTVSLTPESTINFRMSQGRIYHQGIELQLSGVKLRTQGSVGLDQTIAILVEMPIPAQWLGNTPLSGSLASQTISVPVAGTLAHPEIDQNELKRLAADALRNAATGAAESAMRNGVNQATGALQNGLNQATGAAESALQNGLNQGINQLRLPGGRK
ncbi:MAG TPA: hypothetical protein VHZ24_03180 [Pirellulales bacterium]|nr:hypothetical protein [Pirellulales bacterium]